MISINPKNFKWIFRQKWFEKKKKENGEMNGEKGGNVMIVNPVFLSALS